MGRNTLHTHITSLQLVTLSSLYYTHPILTWCDQSHEYVDSAFIRWKYIRLCKWTYTNEPNTRCTIKHSFIENNLRIPINGRISFFDNCDQSPIQSRIVVPCCLSQFLLVRGDHCIGDWYVTRHAKWDLFVSCVKARKIACKRR